jgi:hypothetical protein
VTVLREATASLEDLVNDTLGDGITYTPAGGEASTFNAWVEFDNEELRASGSGSTARVRTVEIPKSKVPTVDFENDRITVTLIPGTTFKPANIEEGAGANTWRITLKKVADV